MNIGLKMEISLKNINRKNDKRAREKEERKKQLGTGEVK